jgi:hypothetical protein
VLMHTSDRRAFLDTSIWACMRYVYIYASHVSVH